ncbi:BnaCnng47270D [Brassica napus]|uniref:(rape) hypothetical protein n=1 Tax=Brassica napus TaxID=3708 RepID=A0A078JJH1_BRANA|nr:unnamed protein product [Brassica napus]CDY65492.1 BnaCnng47270D [Brassica napus]
MLPALEQEVKLRDNEKEKGEWTLHLDGSSNVGVWHTGIVVYGNEYFFGGGIQYLPAGTTPYGAPLRTVELGESHVPKDGPVRLLTQVIHLGEDATRCSFCVL